MGQETFTGDVAFQQRGHTGVVTLNRPQSLNALTSLMCESILVQLEDWAEDPTVTQVLIRGAGERGLCAGGDIASLYHDMVASQDHSNEQVLPGATPSYQDHLPADDFFAAEYAMNLTIAQYSKPVVALMDGVVLGGGVGISAHASHRLVTERSKIGMPETGIGFVPDVGASYLLARAPQDIGLHLGLTGEFIDAADAIALGLADYRVGSVDLPNIIEALDEEDAEQVSQRFAQPQGESNWLQQAEWVRHVYSAGSFEEAYARLEQREEPQAAEAAELLRRRSPTMVKVAYRSIRSAAQLSLAEALEQEFRIAVHALRSHDLKEGVRAQIIDKDRNPQWSPGSFADVPQQLVDQYFSAVPGKELDVRSGRIR